MDRSLRKLDPEKPAAPDFLNFFLWVGSGVDAVFLPEPRCIQRKNNGRFVLVAQDAESSGLNDEMTPVLRR